MTLRESLRGPTEWTPPTSDRSPINIHPEVRAALVRLLFESDMEGVGYSEFVRRAIAAAQEEAFDNSYKDES